VEAANGFEPFNGGFAGFPELKSSSAERPDGGARDGARDTPMGDSLKKEDRSRRRGENASEEMHKVLLCVSRVRFIAMEGRKEDG